MKSHSGPAKTGRKKRVILAVIALLAIGWWVSSSQKAAKEGDDAPPVAEVTRGDVEEVVTAQGKLEAREYVDVGAQVSGQLKKLHVEIGDTVKKGDLIAEIDPRVYESRLQAGKAQLRTMNAQLKEQEATVTFATQQFKRNEKLIELKAVSQEALEDSQASLKVAMARVESLRAQIEEAESSLKEAETNLSYTKIFAPMDGTVVQQTTREGQTVNASQTAPIIVQLADLDVLTVRAQVAEADVMRVVPGMEVSFTTLGNMDRRWKGTVRQVLPTPEIVSDVVLYSALIDVDNKDRQLMINMSTQMFFNLGKAENVLRIPATALGMRVSAEDAEDGKAYKVKRKGQEEPVTVQIGLISRSDAEVKSGLSEGDEVMLSPAAEDAGKRGGGRRMPGPRL